MNDRRASVHGDACQRENIPLKGRVRAKSRGASDLEKDVAPCHQSPCIDLDDTRIACGRERTPDLEDELRVGVTQGIEGECARQLGRGRELIDARREREPSKVLARQVHRGRQARSKCVRGGEIVLRLSCDGIRRVGCPSGHDPRGEAGDRGTWAEPQAPVKDGRTDVGHRRTRQDRKVRCRPKHDARHQDPVFKPFQANFAPTSPGSVP